MSKQELGARELRLLLNSAHERAMRLLDLSGQMSMEGYKNIRGMEPTKEDIDSMYQGHIEHLELFEKL